MVETGADVTCLEDCVIDEVLEIGALVLILVEAKEVCKLVVCDTLDSVEEIREVVIIEVIKPGVVPGILVPEIGADVTSVVSLVGDEELMGIVVGCDIAVLNDDIDETADVLETATVLDCVTTELSDEVTINVELPEVIPAELCEGRVFVVD